MSFLDVPCPEADELVGQMTALTDDELKDRYRECLGTFMPPFGVSFMIGCIWGAVICLVYYKLSMSMTKARALRKVRVKVNDKRESRKKKKWEKHQRDEASREERKREKKERKRAKKASKKSKSSKNSKKSSKRSSKRRH